MRRRDVYSRFSFNSFEFAEITSRVFILNELENEVTKPQI